MHITTVRSMQELISLEKEWNELLAISASHVPFLRHEYITAWWQGLGGGEWEHGELNIVIARSEAGELIGIAPLFLTSNLDGEPALMLLGSIEISDYLDVIARPADLPTFVDALLVYLSKEDPSSSPILDWYNLLESSPTIAALQEAAEKLGLAFAQEQLQHCPFIRLPGDWEQYISSIDKKQRHEIRRKMRRAEEYELPVRWFLAEGGERLREEVESFLGLMACDPEKARFLTPAMRTQIHSIAQAAHKAGWLQLAFIEVNGEKAAAYLNFDYQNHIWVYNSGLDFRFSTLSLGWVLLGHLLKWANDQKRDYFDFMRGDEQYKYRFGAVDRHVVRLTVRK